MLEWYPETICWLKGATNRGYCDGESSGSEKAFAERPIVDEQHGLAMSLKGDLADGRLVAGDWIGKLWS